VIAEMNNDPDEIRTQIAELLGEDLGEDLGENIVAGESDLDAAAARLEEAHELLVHALESVEKG
jgi:hypothetical protein